MLVYHGDELSPIRYTDSDFQSDVNLRKSTFGYVFTLGGATVSWRSIKQSRIADSTMEAEYEAVLEATKEAVWLRKFLMELGVIAKAVDLMILYCDAPKLGCPLTTRQPAEYSWMSGNSTPLTKIGQSLLCTGSSTQIQNLSQHQSHDHIGFISN